MPSDQSTYRGLWYLAKTEVTCCELLEKARGGIHRDWHFLHFLPCKQTFIPHKQRNNEKSPSKCLGQHVTSSTCVCFPTASGCCLLARRHTKDRGSCSFPSVSCLWVSYSSSSPIAPRNLQNPWPPRRPTPGQQTSANNTRALTGIWDQNNTK